MAVHSGSNYSGFRVTQTNLSKYLIMVIEVRSYNLKEGTRDSFHKLFTDKSLPMLIRWGAKWFPMDTLCMTRILIS